MALQAWRPLLDGDLAARARDAIDRMARTLGEGSHTGLGPTLSWGNSGLALLFGYLAVDSGNSSDAELAELFLDEAIGGLAAAPMSAGLYSGFTGVAWTSEHLSQLLGLELAESDDPNAGIDQALLETLADPWQGHFDLGTGLTGIGVYVLERLPRPIAVRSLAAVVDHLGELATIEDQKTTWPTRPDLLSADQREEEPQGVIDLGVPHGMPGVISLLASASQVEACAERARPLLDGAVRWLLSLPRAGWEGFQVGKWLSRRTGRVMPARRLAWCYGDPGVAASLLYAARTVGEETWEREALALATSAAQAPIDTSGIEDTCLCHGAAGLAHLFNRIYQATRQELFADAARQWYRRGLDLLDAGTATSAVDDVGLFTGTAGIGLGLLAAVSDREPEWDRLFGVAIPPSASQMPAPQGHRLL
jgi:lantibiotic modifying enzyme